MKDLFSELSSKVWSERRHAYEKLAIADAQRATDSQTISLDYYTQSHDINLFIKNAITEGITVEKALFEDKSSLSDFINDIDEFLNKGIQTSCDLILYKGIIHKDLKRIFAPFSKDLTECNANEFLEKIYIEPAYMSTTVSESYAFQAIQKNRIFYKEEQSRDLDAIFQVRVPRGTRISALDKISSKLGNSENKQYEILLPRASKFRIQKINSRCILDKKYFIVDIELLL